jgi:hypothetical protein
MRWRTPELVCTTSSPRSPTTDTCSSPIWPNRYTLFLGVSDSASSSSRRESCASSVFLSAFSAPKKRSAGTAPSIPWWGRKKL